MNEKIISGFSNRIMNNYGSYSNNLTISGGLAGICLFLYKASIFLNDEKLSDKFSNLFTRQIIPTVNKPLNDLTLYGGQTGIMWLYQYLINSQVIENDFIQPLLDYDKLILEFCDKLSLSKNYDLLYGLIGIGIYFLERNKCEDKTYELDHIAMLILNSSFKKENTRYWVDLNTHAKGDDMIINLGFAHGLPSIMSFLAKVYDCTKIDSLKFSIKECFKYFILNSRNGIESGDGQFMPYFPHQIVNEKFEGYPSRIAWCYGDLSIGYSMMTAGKLIKDTKIEDYGKMLVLNVCKLNLEEDYTGISDACFCHGIAGVIFATRQISLQLDNPLVIKFEGELLRKFYKMYDSDNMMHTNMFDSRIEKFRKCSEYGFLEGLAGIGLSILPKESYDWKNLVLF